MEREVDCRRKKEAEEYFAAQESNEDGESDKRRSKGRLSPSTGRAGGRSQEGLPRGDHTAQETRLQAALQVAAAKMGDLYNFGLFD